MHGRLFKRSGQQMFHGGEEHVWKNPKLTRVTNVALESCLFRVYNSHRVATERSGAEEGYGRLHPLLKCSGREMLQGGEGTKFPKVTH